MSGAIVAASIGAAGAIGGGLIASQGASKAADAQVSAAQTAAQSNERIANQNIAEQNRVLAQQMQLLSPFYMQGEGALANLGYLMGIPNGNAPLVNPANLASALQAPQVGANGQPVASGGNARTGSFPVGFPGGPGQNPSVANANGEIVANPATGGLRGDVNPVSGRPIPGGVPAGVTPAQTAGMGQSLSSLVNPALGGQGSLYNQLAAQFVAPDNVTEQNDPGYKFRLEQGLLALDMGAAARGGLLTGGTMMAENDYAQNQASNEYGNVYGRAVNQYQLNRQSALDRYNALANMAGQGQLSSGQGIAAAGQFGGNVSNILNLLASNQAQAYNNIGAARASGYVGGANALSAGIGGATNSIGQYMMLQQLLGNSGGNYNSATPAGYTGGAITDPYAGAI